MARKKVRAEATATRKQTLLSSRERRAQRTLLIAIAVVGLSIVGVILYGLFRSGVIASGQPVATVGDDVITVSDFRKQVRLRYHFAVQNAAAQQGIDPSLAGALVDPELVGQNTLDGMVEEILVRRVAQENGITVSESEVDDAIRAILGFAPLGDLPPAPTPIITPDSATPTATSTLVLTQTPFPTVEGVTPQPTPLPPTPTEAVQSDLPEVTPTPTPTREPPSAEEEAAFQEAFEAQFGEWAEVSGLTQAELRDQIEYQLLFDQLYSTLELDVPLSAEQALISHILTASSEEAEDLLQDLTAQNFAEMAAANSLDPITAYRGGELGWASRDTLELVVSPDFAELAFTLPIDQPGGPVQTTQGFHILLVNDRQEAPLTQSEFLTRRDEAFTTFVEDLRDEAVDTIEIDQHWQRFLPTFT